MTNTGYENRVQDLQKKIVSTSIKDLSYRAVQALAKEVRDVSNKPVKLNSTKSDLTYYITNFVMVRQDDAQVEVASNVEVLTDDINGYSHQYTDGNLTGIKFGYNSEFSTVYYSQYEPMFTRLNSCKIPKQDPTPKTINLTSTLPAPNHQEPKSFSVTTTKPVATSKPAKRTNTPKATKPPVEGKVKAIYKKPEEYCYAATSRPSNYSKVVDYRLMNERVKARKEGKTYSMNPLHVDFETTTKSGLVDTGNKHPKGASVYVSLSKVVTYK